MACRVHDAVSNATQTASQRIFAHNGQAMSVQNAAKAVYCVAKVGAAICERTGFAFIISGLMRSFLPFRQAVRARYRVLDACVFLLLMLLCGLPLRAAQPPVTMQVDSPFALATKPLGLQIKTGRWFPVAVTLSNSGDAVSGRLQLQLTSSGNGSSRNAAFYADVDLPTNARKRVWLYGRGEGQELDGANISFSGRNIKTQNQNVTLKPLDLGERTILTISDSGEKSGFLTGLKGENLAVPEDLSALNQQNQYNQNNQSSTRNTFLRPLGSAHEWIPDRAIGLESADVVVLRDFAQSALTPEQLDALRNYVAQGGTIVVFGGSDWQRLSSSPLKDLWPIDAASSNVASASETAQIVNRYIKSKTLSGADRLGGAPLVLTRGALRADAKNLVPIGASSWLSERDYGAGRVLMMSGDPSAPPFLGWSGQGALWTEVMRNLPRVQRLESVGHNGYDNSYYKGYGYNGNTTIGSTEQLLSVIKKLPQLQTPPTSVIAWFLAVYVFCLVPLNYFILRGIDKRELAWVTIPVIAVVFSVASYLAARNIKGTDLLVRQVNIVQGSGTGNRARTDAMLWLYSPRRANYDISSTQPLALADYVAGDFNAPASSLNLQQPDAAKSFRVEGAAVKMWDEAEFVAQGATSTKGGLSVQKSGTAYRVLNRTPFSLRGAVLVSGNRIFRCGDIASGATANATSVGTAASSEDLVARIAAASSLETIFPSPKSASANTASSNSALADSTLRDLAAATLRAGLPTDVSSDTSLLIAWGTAPVAPLTIEGESARQQSVTLFLFRLPLK